MEREKLEILVKNFVEELEEIKGVEVKKVKIEFDKEKYIKRVTEKLKEEISKIYKDFQQTLEAMRKSFEEEIKELQERIEKEKREGIVEGIKLAHELGRTWKVENGYIIYKKIIKPKMIKYQEKVYKLPSGHKFFVKGLRVRLTPRVYNDDVRISSAFHPNVDPSNNNVCLGDLEGKEISVVLRKIVKELEVINLDSAFDSEAKEEAEEIVNELEEGEGGDVWYV